MLTMLRKADGRGREGGVGVGGLLLQDCSASEGVKNHMDV